MIVYLQLLLHLHHQVMHVVPLNGLVTTTVMMTTIMKNVVGMGMIVVEPMLIQHIVLLVNAWIHKEDHLKNLVDHLTGSMMVIVMMKTTMKHVVGMGRIAVGTM